MTPKLSPDVQALAQWIQTRLGLSIRTGSLTLNFNNGDFLSWDYKEHGKAPMDVGPKSLDTSARCG